MKIHSCATEKHSARVRRPPKRCIEKPPARVNKICNCIKIKCNRQDRRESQIEKPQENQEFNHYVIRILTRAPRLIRFCYNHTTICFVVLLMWTWVAMKWFDWARCHFNNKRSDTVKFFVNFNDAPLEKLRHFLVTKGWQTKVLNDFELKNSTDLTTN